MNEIINVTPGTNLLGVLGGSGYTFNTAIADILDNSIYAGASEIDIHWDYDALNPKLTIIDNGQGMNAKEVKEAAIIANKSIDQTREHNDLGRFSTGLKSASVSFCGRLIIISKKVKSEAHNVVFDFDEVKRSNKWYAVYDHHDYLDFNEHDSGTMIIWENLKILDVDVFKDNRFVFEKLEDLSKDLSHIFGRIIRESKLTITVNGKNNIIKAWDPFYTTNEKTQHIFEDKKAYKGEEIEVNGFILPVYSNLAEEQQEVMKGKGLREQQGFYIFRNKRLIQEGGWLGLEGIKLDSKSDYARIMVDISSNLDKYFKVNYLKNSIELPAELHADFIKIAKFMKKESTKNFNYKKKPIFKKSKGNEVNVPVWETTFYDGCMHSRLNRDNPVIKNLACKLTKKEYNQLLTIIEEAIPISVIQSNSVNVKDNTKKNIPELIDDHYKILFERGLNIDQIKMELAKIEPINNHMDLIYEYFTKKGDL